MSSIFTKIINGEIPCHKVAENEDYFAFLDIRPLREGHTLVIPKKEVDYIFDLEDELFTGLHAFSKQIAPALKETMPCTRVAVMVLGLEVPHAHIHLIPIETEADVSLSKPRLDFTQEELALQAEKIRKAL
jgi:histidine triad (HIT) family protein